MTTPIGLDFSNGSIVRLETKEQLMKLAEYLGQKSNWNKPMDDSVNCLVTGTIFGDQGHWGTVNSMWNCNDPSKLEKYCTLYRDGLMIAEVNLANLFNMACELPKVENQSPVEELIQMKEVFNQDDICRWLYDKTVGGKDFNPGDCKLTIYQFIPDFWFFILRLIDTGAVYHYQAQYHESLNQMTVVSTQWDSLKIYHCIDLEQVRSGLINEILTHADDLSLGDTLDILEEIKGEYEPVELLKEVLANENSELEPCEIADELRLDLNEAVKNALDDDTNLDWVEIGRKAGINIDEVATELIEETLDRGFDRSQLISILERYSNHEPRNLILDCVNGSDNNQLVELAKGLDIDIPALHLQLLTK